MFVKPVSYRDASSPGSRAHRLLCALGLLLGCTSAAKPRPAAPPPAAPAASVPAAPAPTPSDVLTRTEVVQVLDRGPQAFLASIRQEPLVIAGRFRGWVFRGWQSAPFGAVDLQPGDVVTRVNGKPIERPEQFMAVWEELRTAPALVIEGLRNGKPHEVRYTIRDN